MLARPLASESIAAIRRRAGLELCSGINSPEGFNDPVIEEESITCCFDCYKDCSCQA